MNVILESLGDPIWQIGGGIIILATLVLILALRNPEVHLAPRHQWLLMRITGLACLSLFLVLSAGVVLFHGANAALSGASGPSSATTSSPGELSPSSTSVPALNPFPSPSPSL